MHGGRMVYCVPGEGNFEEPPPTNGGGPQGPSQPNVSLLRFGRMFGKTNLLPPSEGKDLFDKLVALGRCMSDPTTCGQQPVVKESDESDITSGYTYLGQFIAHEITFDDSADTLQVDLDPHNLRTPQIDLDSLYGGTNGQRDKPELYDDDGVKLKVGVTSEVRPPKKSFNFHDLPRDKENKANPKLAFIVDERNDENLAVAQTLVAFINFHNAVVDYLRGKGHEGGDDLFQCARRQVVRHFQWIIVHDFLRKLLDNDVLDCVLRHGQRWFKEGDYGGLYMPLEFSAAAFRIGHTMVRPGYSWNRLHPAAAVSQLFGLTGFFTPKDGFDPKIHGFPSGSASDFPLLRLPSDWVIDWTRFYDFKGLLPDDALPPDGKINRTSKLDTVLNFRLADIPGIRDSKLEAMQRAITVRNLLRGFYLGLPTGEEVAEWIGETPLKPEDVAEGPHKSLLSDRALRGKTPLWYYVLKEAELLGKGSDGKGGHRLGPVGSRIIAETLIGLIRKSPHSILDEPDWRPKFGREVEGPERVKFEMPDLLKFAFGGDASGEKSVNPLGQRP